MKQTKFKTKKPTRNYLIDTIKWVCMIFVIYQHVPPQFAPLYLHENFWIRFAVPTFLLLSGYTWSLSNDRHNITNLHDMYKPSLLFKKFLRLAIPWFALFIISTILNYTLHETWNWLGFFRHIIQCGYGAGDYFLVVMLQLIILFPLIFYFIDKYDFKGFIGIFIFTAVFEVFRWACDMNSTVYMNLSIRYFAFIAFGAYLYKSKDKAFSFKDWRIDLLMAASFALGFVYIWFCFENPVLQNNSFFINISGGGGWMLHSTCFGSLYLLPLMFMLFKKVKMNVSWVGYMGKCSYSIFLIQMFIFSTFSFIFNKSNADITHNFYFLWFLAVFGSFLGGWLYYLLFEKIITNKIVNTYTKYLNKKTLK